MYNKQNKSIAIGTSEDQNINFKTFEERCQIIENRLKHQSTLQLEVRQSKRKGPFNTNHDVSLNGNQIIKMTEIQFENRVLKIIDKFTPISKSQLKSLMKQDNSNLREDKSVSNVQNSTQNSSQKKLIGRSKKTKKKQDDEDFKFRDIKNVIKNIFKLFQNWAQNNSPVELQLSDALSQLLASHKKYNNELLLLISKESNLRNSFIAFCETQGEYSIECSKIMDKESHIEALRTYQKICQDHKQKEQGSQVRSLKAETKIKEQDLKHKNGIINISTSIGLSKNRTK